MSTLGSRSGADGHVRPLIRVLVEGGFQEDAATKPTLQTMRRFARKQKIAVRGNRQALVAALLTEVRSAPAGKKWCSAAQEEKSDSEPEEEDLEGKSSSESDESDPEDWADMKVIYSLS